MQDLLQTTPMPERSFSPRCGNCRQRTMALVTIPFEIQIDHHGRKYLVRIPALSVPKCTNCGEISIDYTAEKAIDNAFRKEARLLTPEQIHEGRCAIGYTKQQAFADCLGVAVATLSRWETGAQVQERIWDDVLKAFFTTPAGLSGR